MCAWRSVQLLSHVRLFATLWTAPRQASLSITNSQSLLTFTVHWVGMPSNYHPLSSPSPLDFNLSQHQGLFQWVGSSGGQSIGVSASASGLPVNIQDWSPLGWTGWSSLQSKGLSRVFSNTTVQKHQFFELSFLYSPTLTSIPDYWKNHSFDELCCWTFVGKVMSLLFNILSRLVIIFLPRSKLF